MEGCWTTAVARSRRTREGWSRFGVTSVDGVSVSILTPRLLRSHWSDLPASESSRNKTGFPFAREGRAPAMRSPDYSHHLSSKSFSESVPPTRSSEVIDSRSDRLLVSYTMLATPSARPSAIAAKRPVQLAIDALWV